VNKKILIILLSYGCYSAPSTSQNPVVEAGNDLQFPVDSKGFLRLPPDEDELRRQLKELIRQDEMEKRAEARRSNSASQNPNDYRTEEARSSKTSNARGGSSERMSTTNRESLLNSLNGPDDPSMQNNPNNFRVEQYIPRNKVDRSPNPYRLDDSQIYDPNNPNPHMGWDYLDPIEREPGYYIEDYMGEGE
jgi:hypothetical protein